MDVHNSERKLQRMIEKIKNSNEISKENKEHILGFERNCYTIQRISASRVLNYMVQMSKIGKLAKKNLADFNKDDVLSIVETIERNGYIDKKGVRQEYLPATKSMFRVCIKKFFRWLRNTEWPDVPLEVRSLSTTIKRNEEKFPDILSFEEINMIVDKADNVRDKALMAVITEGGLRPCEVVNLKLKNLSFDDYGAILMVQQGKTGFRRIRIIAFSSFLAMWLNLHPEKNNPEASLWTGIANSNRGLPLGYRAVSNIIKKLVKKAGINKKVWPYLFRHTRLTLLAKEGFNESEIAAIAGWRTSEPAKTYIHISGMDVEEKMLKKKGLIKGDNQEFFSVIPCPRCSYRVNPFGAKVCQRCGFPLELKTSMQLEEKRNKLNAKMDVLFQDKDFMDFLKNKVQQLNL